MGISKEIVQAVRVLRYVGTREAVERTLNQSIQGTKVIGESLTIHAAELGRVERIGGMDYDEAYPILLDIVTSTNFMRASQADQLWHEFQRRGVALVQVRG